VVGIFPLAKAHRPLDNRISLNFDDSILRLVFTQSTRNSTLHNFIIEFKQALSADFCQQLISKFENDPNQMAGRTGAGVDTQKKDSTDLHISQLADWQDECHTLSQIILRATVQYARQYPFLLTGAISPTFIDPKTQQTRTILHDDISQLDEQELQGLISAIFRLDEINLQRYTRGSGGYHHWHSEHFPHPSDQSQRSLHRVLLWLIYLNDVEQGGETEFYYQQAQVKPTQGSLILAPCGFSHTHRGHIPRSHDKYVLASWLMYRPAEELYRG